MGYMGGCQNHGAFLGPYYNTAPNIEGTQKVTIILTTTHIEPRTHCLGDSRVEQAPAHSRQEAPQSAAHD